MAVWFEPWPELLMVTLEVAEIQVAADGLRGVTAAVRSAPWGALDELRFVTQPLLTKLLLFVSDKCASPLEPAF